MPDTMPLHVPLKTVDEWVAQLHKAVEASNLCAWRVKPKGKDECIQAIGIATLRYGYKFKFRFNDPYRGNGDVPAEHVSETGQLCFNGAPVGSVLHILRNGFKPSNNSTGEDKLKSKFWCCTSTRMVFSNL